MASRAAPRYWRGSKWVGFSARCLRTPAVIASRRSESTLILHTAMEAAFNHGEEWLEQLLEYISGNLDYIKEYFDTRIPLIRANIPDATYLVWLDCRKLNMTDQELKEFMIRKAGLGLNPGSDFTRALSGFMRLNAACPRATLEKALGQLERAVNELAH